MLRFRPRSFATLPAALTLLLALPLAASAQSVLGEVLEEGFGAAVPGALVELRRDDAVVDRTLTNSAGVFLLEASGAGRFRLRIERIGYHRWTSDPLELTAGERRSIRIEIPVQAIRVSDLDVTASRECRADPRASRRAARIWEETRKALESLRVASRQGLLRFRIREYLQRTDEQLDIVDETSKSFMAVGRHPFESLAADDLSGRGYIRPAGTEEGSAVDFFAPDASTLLSSRFRADHCFRVAGRKDGMIGLAFRPVESRTTADIEGTFWLDAYTARLRLLTFRYTNVEVPSHDHPMGGRVEFVRLTDGSLVVRRWWIRMPRIARRLVWTGHSVSGGRDIVIGYDVEGGEVLEAFSPGGDTLSIAGTSALVGTVRRRGSGEPVAGATVRLGGVDRSSVTDGTGYFRLDLLTGGRYELAVRDSLMAAAGLEPWVGEMRLEPEASREVSVELPGRSGVHGAMCPDEPPVETAPGHHRTAAVAGFVRDAGGRAVPGGVVEVRWKKWRTRDPGGRRPSGNRVEREEVVHRTGVDLSGAYRFCHLPAEWTIRVRTLRDSSGEAGEQRTLQLAEDELRRLELEAPPTMAPDSAAEDRGRKRGPAGPAR